MNEEDVKALKAHVYDLIVQKDALRAQSEAIDRQIAGIRAKIHAPHEGED